MPAAASALRSVWTSLTADEHAWFIDHWPEVAGRDGAPPDPARLRAWARDPLLDAPAH